MEIVMHGGDLSVAASFDCPDAARRALQAVVLARQFGLASVDYTRHTYVDPHSQRPPEHTERRAAIEITAAAKELVRRAMARAPDVQDKPDHAGMFAAGAAMLRLTITFRLATLSIRQGFHFESALLARRILEQLAWAKAVRPRRASAPSRAHGPQLNFGVRPRGGGASWTVRARVG